MNDVEREKHARAALNFSNEVRKRFGYPPARKLSKGYASDPSSCPIANTIRGRSSLNVNVDEMMCTSSRSLERIVKNVPAEVRRFIDAFDGGVYPELEDFL